MTMASGAASSMARNVAGIHAAAVSIGLSGFIEFVPQNYCSGFPVCHGITQIDILAWTKRISADRSAGNSAGARYQKARKSAQRAYIIYTLTSCCKGLLPSCATMERTFSG